MTATIARLTPHICSCSWPENTQSAFHGRWGEVPYQNTSFFVHALQKYCPINDVVAAGILVRVLRYILHPEMLKREFD